MRRSPAAPKISIRSVAERAGVSIKTVSRVLNNERGVAQITEEIVREAIEQLGYVPNESARRLAGSRSYTLALASPSNSWTWLGPVKSGFSRACQERGFSLIETSNPATLRSAELDGVVLLHVFAGDEDLKDQLRSDEVPYACVLTGGHEPNGISVNADEEQGMRLITEHLIDLGHQRLAYIGTSADYPGAHARRQGFLKAVRQHRKRLPEPVLVNGDLSPRSGYEQGLSLLRQKAQDSRWVPTAIACANDEMAAGVLRAAYEREVRVPDQLSVTGFDDSRVAQELTAPSLTSARLPFDAIGYQAARLLMRAEHLDTFPQARLVMELVARDSSGPLRSKS